MASMRRVLEFGFEFTVDEGKMSEVRVKAAYLAAQEAVVRAVQSSLPDGMIGDVRTSLNYGYEQFKDETAITVEEVQEIAATNGSPGSV